MSNKVGQGRFVRDHNHNALFFPKICSVSLCVCGEIREAKLKLTGTMASEVSSDFGILSYIALFHTFQTGSG